MNIKSMFVKENGIDNRANQKRKPIGLGSIFNGIETSAIVLAFFGFYILGSVYPITGAIEALVNTKIEFSIQDGVEMK